MNNNKALSCVNKLKMNFKENKREFVVLSFLALITFCKGLGLSSNDKIYVIIFIIASICMLLKAITDKFTKKEFVIIFSLLGIGILNLIIGNQTVILFTAIILCCMKNVSIEKTIKVMFVARLIAYLLIIFLVGSGICENNYMLFYRDGEYIKRYSLIFSHPNLAHSSFAIIVILGIYIFYNKLNVINVLIVEVLNYGLYLLTYSRTGFLICSIFLIFALLFKKFKIIQKIIKKIIKYYLIFLIFLSLLSGILYDKVDIFQKADKLLTGRIGYINELITKYDIPIIGNQKYNEDVLFDNGYISLLYEGGLLATIWFIYIYNKTTKLLIKENRNKEILLLIIFMTYSITESYLPNVIMNPTLLFFALYIFRKSKGDNINEDNNTNSNYE